MWTSASAAAALAIMCESWPESGRNVTPSAVRSSEARWKSSRDGLREAGAASDPVANGGSGCSRPSSALRAGRRKSSAPTRDETGFPGRPKTSVPLRAPNESGFPGRIATPQSASSTPRRPSVSRTRSWGPTETPPLKKMVTAGGDKYINAMVRGIPLGRLGQPVDVAAAVAFFASGEAGFITGQTLSVSGGMTMVYGGVPYVAMALPQILRVPWTDVSTWTLASLVLSALLALNLAYVIWYMGVQRLGPARTSIYSNGVPIVAMTVAALWLGEPLTWNKVIGAAAVLSGVLLTRLGRREQTPVDV